ncbi:MAG: GlcG/HbpS family heme-binding protein [Burkholderiaceae bacterium]|jgi:glc operon protein GlcG|nr:heme-binding protein [Burkholderiaceae bacterium]MDP4863154.1 heme-binding protein [Burkholderiaceae bacterium]
MKTKSYLESADVKAILQAAEAEAVANNWNVAIAVVDDGGHLLGFQRLNGTPAVSAHIAQAKANTSALGCRESKIYEDVINQGRTSFLSAPAISGLLEGGVPIMKDGVCIGAVGVSGVKSNEDAQIAKAGIAALNIA